MPETISDRLPQARTLLAKADQSHLLAFWEELNDDQRRALLEDIDRINFGELAELVEGHVCSAEPFSLPSDIQPVEFYPVHPGADLVGKYAEAVKQGVSLIGQNKVAVFTVAGGQGTRLGFDGPKGAYPISPVRNKPLFQLFAESIRGSNRRYNADLHWFIMTSPQNDADTQTFFQEQGYFGLAEGCVHFFQQGVMPAFSPEGKILLDRKHRVAFSPDGHGGSLLALQRSGALTTMAELGVEHLSYHQVDNPLVKVVDPLFIGLHDLTHAELSSKTIPKADDLERVGNFVVGDGKMMVIEYSDLPDELAHARNEKGKRAFDAGSIGIHLFRRDFAERMTSDHSHFGLPWHRAQKKTPFIDETGARIEPTGPNAIKLESFIFDAIPLAAKPLILQTSRAEEFSPVKNATGVDSAETSRRDLNRRAAAWLDQAGFDIPRLSDGEPDGRYEISPLAALDADELCERSFKAEAICGGGECYLGGNTPGN